MTGTLDVDLSDRQRELIHHLPGSKYDIAAEIGVAATTVKGYIEACREKDIDIGWDRDAGQYYLADERAQQLRRTSTKHKTSKTREATSIIEEEETLLLRQLERTQPLSAPPTEDPSSETFCAILSDLHFGDVVTKEFYDPDLDEHVERTVYDNEIAAESVRTFGEKLLATRDRMEARGVTFDDCYLFLLGDLATGESIYDGQAWDIQSMLADQVTHSEDALYQLSRTLAREFDTVQIRGVLGNHGRTRASASHGANTDLITYYHLDRLLRAEHLYDNVNFAIGSSHHHLNTEVRDWRFHLRHGQDGRQHVDATAASSRDWRGWREEHRFDLAMRGHFHNPSLDYVMNKFPVFTAPSPKPGSEFASRIGSPDVSATRHLGWVFGTSDTRPVTWQFLLDDQ